MRTYAVESVPPGRATPGQRTNERSERNGRAHFDWEVVNTYNHHMARKIHLVYPFSCDPLIDWVFLSCSPRQDNAGMSRHTSLVCGLCNVAGRTVFDFFGLKFKMARVSLQPLFLVSVLAALVSLLLLFSFASPVSCEVEQQQQQQQQYKSHTHHHHHVIRKKITATKRFSPFRPKHQSNI